MQIVTRWVEGGSREMRLAQRLRMRVPMRKRGGKSGNISADRRCKYDACRIGSLDDAISRCSTDTVRCHVGRCIDQSHMRVLTLRFEVSTGSTAISKDPHVKTTIDLRYSFDLNYI